jgi:cytochrome c-type biogenesis protein CcmH/NrfG
MLAGTMTLSEAAASLSRGNHAEAVRLFSEAIGRDDQDIQACHGLAWSLIQLARAKLPILRSADLELAAEALRHALALKPDNPVTTALLSLCLVNARAPERASEVLQTFLGRNPHDVEAVGLIAELAAQPEQAPLRLGFQPQLAVYSGPRLGLPKHRRDRYRFR